ncbi:MAG: hypothetical protein EOQ86_06200 [Mesorhizobium sp.]|uniref:hypothetical protein n=1 Tax=Mesorhizobium sp. TaxID=1871066 RepID=UPI000FE8DE39|nr:hypothetical protein [Mesorhizobium sp.]RWH81272.1 MAG: hypothetical protein EOQ85_09590 [Mesorhizobium sp.]RWH85755.1 MAG: hypothetical protein EOQ86_06200 [Mesorhizobium sp.]RWH91012.1 MAG: hypothetical protein EOQ87_09855 [Mesorhizobium sp.]RWH99694.1 MAG: hypothetical protein EOQ88_09960 [Mesorhizobium sp.]RWI04064.1 MAG: hypothetical protein EOQ89_10950 [Mesorhizobium sp.]
MDLQQSVVLRGGNRRKCGRGADSAGRAAIARLNPLDDSRAALGGQLSDDLAFIAFVHIQVTNPGSSAASQELPSLLSVFLDMIWELLYASVRWALDGLRAKERHEMNYLSMRFAIAPMMDWTDIAKSNVYSAT